MADATVPFRLHEQRDIFVTLTPASGTLTLVSATLTLYDAEGAVAGAVQDTAATGYTLTAGASVQAWYLLKPAVLGLTAEANYVATFRCTDSNGNVYEPTVLIVLMSDSEP